MSVSERWLLAAFAVALSGINVFYAITGQEEIQYKAFKQFGLTDLEIREFFNGPAYLTWSRGQSMQTVGTGKRCEFSASFCRNLPLLLGGSGPMIMEIYSNICRSLIDL